MFGRYPGINPVPEYFGSLYTACPFVTAGESYLSGWSLFAIFILSERKPYPSVVSWLRGDSLVICIISCDKIGSPDFAFADMYGPIRASPTSSLPIPAALI